MRFSPGIGGLAALCVAVVLLGSGISPSRAEGTAFRQAVAEAAYGSEAIAAFYRMRGYQPFFTSEDGATHRAALLRAVSRAGMHGLPADRYDTAALLTAFRQAKTLRDLGKAEIMAARMFVRIAQDLQSGVLTPRRIDPDIVRELPRRDPVALLSAFEASAPHGFMQSLAPKTREYANLMKEKMRLQRVLAAGGWGSEVPSGKYEPGQSGQGVVTLRNRLIAMEFMPRSARSSYDDAMKKAVQDFQIAHGLDPDGVAGPATIAEINVSAEQRLGQVLVAMERERWTNIPRGDRHIRVNIPEFTARLMDDGKESFSTRVVVGKDTDDRRTPEFSDVMEFMVINPTWSVPRSIATKEYLPMLKKNRNAVGHLKLIDSRGRVVKRGNVNFANYTARSFPFRLKQPPSKRNALGLVKFMFPNKHNIYLHDTPSKSLFERERRAFSHGCVRVGDPFDLAYALLARQTDDPEGLFQSRLRTGSESRVNLEQPVPVHIMYRTAFTDPRGRANYRHDIYGRDARIWAALQKAGVSLATPGS